jgi:hypothetical protein
MMKGGIPMMTIRLAHSKKALVLLAVVWWSFGFLTCALVCSMTGCAAYRTDATGKKTRTATAIEQVMAWNAALADSNLAIAKGVIAANEANEIGVPESNRILTAQSKIADADRQLTPLLAKACGPMKTDRCNPSVLSNDAAAISGFLDAIRDAATGLVKSGDVGIKNPARKQAVQTAVEDIYSLADRMIDALKTLGVLK